MWVTRALISLPSIYNFAMSPTRDTSRWIGGLLALCLLLLLPGAVAAQEPTDAPTINEVAQELYCPLCSGLTVDVCELEVCADMRDVIAQKLAAGESKTQIKAYFVEQYGQKVVGHPATEGFHLTAWLVPFAALLGAAAVLVLWLRRRPAAPALQPIVPTLAPDERARLERELQRLEDS